MFVAITFVSCVVCIKAYRLWIKPRREAGAAASPCVGMLGGLIEPRK